MVITHSFVSAAADGADATLLRPSNWNANHVITADTIANILSDHNKAAHDALLIDAATLDGVDSLGFVKADGTVALSANWDAGSFEIRAETFESDVLAPTAPFIVASAILCTNLNADLLDGNHAAAFATSAQGVTNGDTHDHSGGDGAQSNHTTLSNIGTNTHAQIDTHIAAANPHSSTALATPDRLMLRDAAGRCAVVAPSAATDIALKSTVTADIATHASLTASHGAGAAIVGTTDIQTLTNKTLTIPTIGSFANANHTHAATGATGGAVDHVNLSNKGTLTHAQIDTILVRSSGIAGLTSGADARKDILSDAVGGYANSPAINDKTYLYFFCDGTETVLNIITNANTEQAKWNLYVNGVLDSSNYDDYSASSVNTLRVIILTQPIVTGRNTIMLHAASKNAASSNYLVKIVWAVVQPP